MYVGITVRVQCTIQKLGDKERVLYNTLVEKSFGRYKFCPWNMSPCNVCLTQKFSRTSCN